MTGIEIDFVVSDSLAALDLYERIFDVERVEVTDFPKGQNEVVFTIYGTRFHMLDENPEYQLYAPKAENDKSIWFNVLVTDIRKTYESAMAAGSVEVQPVTEMPEMGGSNAIFIDKFGYLWMLHEIKQEVSFEERVNYLEKEMKK